MSMQVSTWPAGVATYKNLLHPYLLIQANIAALDTLQHEFHRERDTIVEVAIRLFTEQLHKGKQAIELIPDGTWHDGSLWHLQVVAKEPQASRYDYYSQVADVEVQMMEMNLNVILEPENLPFQVQ